MFTAYLKVKLGEKHMRALGYSEWDCVAGITKEDVGAFWAVQPFDRGMDPHFGNRDLRWKNEG
jgi:hypothetical protein